MTRRFPRLGGSRFISQTISEILRTPADRAPLPLQDEVTGLWEPGVHTWVQTPKAPDQLARVVARALQE